jgi:hypothetical protein
MSVRPLRTALLALVLTAVLASVLPGCGHSGSTDPFAGTWQLTSNYDVNAVISKHKGQYVAVFYIDRTESPLVILTRRGNGLYSGKDVRTLSQAMDEKQWAFELKGGQLTVASPNVLFFGDLFKVSDQTKMPPW